MYKFYVVEIQRFPNGEYGHIVHEEQDADEETAKNKGESKYYAVLSAAAISTQPSHAAILFDEEGNPLLNKCYKHGDQNQQS